MRYQSGPSLTEYGFTGQFGYTGSFGLIYFNARWLDVSLGRFAQADSIVPPGAQGLDRYAYVNNSPMNYVDPSGHIAGNDDYCTPNSVNLGGNGTTNPLVEFAEDPGHEWEESEKAVIERGARDVANALARDMNNQCRTFMALGEGCSGLVTGQEAFYEVFGGSITVRRSGSDCDCWAMNQGVINGHHEIWVYSTISTQDILAHPLLIVHEIGHAFDVASGIDANSLISNDLLRPINSDGIVGTDAYGGNYGYAGPHYQWQFGRASNNRAGEEYADMFVGWVYNQWEGSALGTQRQEFMNALMISYLP